MNSHLKKDYKNEYKILKKLGEGNYTTVYQTENKKTKELLQFIRQKIKRLKNYEQ